MDSSRCAGADEIGIEGADRRPATGAERPGADDARGRGAASADAARTAAAASAGRPRPGLRSKRTSAPKRERERGPKQAQTHLRASAGRRAARDTAALYLISNGIMADK